MMERPDLDALEREYVRPNDDDVKELVAYARHLEDRNARQRSFLREILRRRNRQNQTKNERITELEQALEPFAQRIVPNEPLSPYVTIGDFENAARVLRKGAQWKS